MLASCDLLTTQSATRSVGGFAAPPPHRWGGAPSAQPAARNAAALGALADGDLAARFCAWRGASARRYVFSVYAAPACPAYCDAVLVAAAPDRDGRRRMVAVFDTGVFPEPVLARAQEALQAFGAGVELHVHLLAASATERRAAIEDLRSEAAYDPRN